MENTIVINPFRISNSSAILKVQEEYIDVKTNAIVSTEAINTAIGLGFDIAPKYKKHFFPALYLKLQSTEVKMTREMFNAFVSLFAQLSKDIPRLSVEESIVASKLPWPISTISSKTLIEDTISVTFPNGEVVEIKAKTAKVSTLTNIIPESYYYVKTIIQRINSYDVKYFSKNKAFKIGCNTILSTDLDNYFNKIRTSWDELDNLLESLNN